MVAIPDSRTDPVLLNGIGITVPNNSNSSNDDNLTDDTRRVRDQAFTIPRVITPASKNNYTLKFENMDNIDDKKLNPNNINAEPVVMKKVAAGLKTINGQRDKKDMPGGNGSLSSGSSMVTISSVAISDPDPDERADPNGHGNKRNIRNEKWYHTILQVSVPFFIAGIGTIGAGRVLTSAKDLEAFKEVPQLLILTTALQGLKDFVMIAVIMISYRYKMNPDNLATPLAASIGDVVSISILSAIASEFFRRLKAEIWVLYVVFGFFLVVLPFWILIVLKNKYTKSVLKSGWVPILSALLISGGGGLVLERMVDSYDGFEVFQPVINGIGGNLVSVQASRMSTMLHQSSIMGILPPHGKIWVFPWAALFVGSPYAKTARLLVAMAIPGQLIFVFIADALNPGDCTMHAYFVISYIIVSVLQVMVLLYVAHIIIHAMWRYKIDPDNSAIPYLTALGDLSGSLLLALAFFFIYSIINQPYCTEK
ncbi:solute carrier family 41 member 2 isoform X2 [Polyergus mexicanus]|uniref:solute carrier family 41 member 2 isoform X2 n=1 Tax=Polyergus mexicanus TaxID=615972 RepID=UPI0038B5FC35